MHEMIRELVLVLLTAFCFAIVSAKDQEACKDFDDLRRNANPEFLDNCVTDSNCTQLSCQCDSNLANFFNSVKFIPVQCAIPSGIHIELTDVADGVTVLVAETFSSPGTITGSNFVGNVTLNIHVAVPSTSVVEFSIDRVDFETILFGSSSHYLINSTSITIDKCGCSSLCCAETIPTESGTTYRWPETLAGASTTFICPLSREHSVTRVCSSIGEWQSFNEEGCGVANGQLIELEDVFANLTVENYEDAVSMLTQILQASENNTVEQNSHVLGRVALYFSQLAVFMLETDVEINTEVVDELAQTVNTLNQWQPTSLNIPASTVSTIIESFETGLTLFAQRLDLNEKRKFTTSTFTAITELTEVNQLVVDGRTFATGENETILTTSSNNSIGIFDGELSPQLEAAIDLPPSLFEKLTNQSNTSLFFVHYKESTLFPVNQGNNLSNSSNETIVGSNVLAATVGLGNDFQELDRDSSITAVFRIQKVENLIPGSENCVSWDFEMNDWTSKGCTTSENQVGLITCSCNHLTNFAVLVDICLRQEGCTESPTPFEAIHTYISYIGMSISIFFLIVTIFTLLVFKDLRQKDVSKYHVQLSLAILLMLLASLVLVALSAGDISVPYEGCLTVSVLVHYFTLGSVMWMGAEALLMFQKLVLVFVHITKKFIVSVSIVCWVGPIVVVIIPLVLDLVNGDDIANDLIIRRVNSTESEGPSFCFLSHIGVFWGAFLAPIFAVMLFNLVIFVCVIVVLIRYISRRSIQKQEEVSGKVILRMLFSISGVMFLFGLTWLFAILTVSVTGLRETFQLLFTIFNSLQGFFIFVFLLNAEAAAFWKKVCSCGTKPPQTSSRSRGKQSSSGTAKTGLCYSTSGGTLKSEQEMNTLEREKTAQ